MHDRPVPRVGHRDDRRHDAGAVAEALEDAEGPLEDLGDLDEERADRRRHDELLEVGTRRHRREHVVRPAGQDLAGEPRAPSREVDHPDLAKGRGKAAIVVELLRELDGATVGLFGTVEVDLHRDRTERLTDRAPKERLAELERRPELCGAVAAVGGADPGATGQLCGGVLVVAHPQRRRAPELHVELDGRIAHRLGEGGQLGQAVEPVAGPAQDGERIVAGREQDPPVGRRRHDRKRLLDEPERLLGGVRGEGGRGRIDREARGPHGVTGRQRVLGKHRQAGRGWVATVQQQVDDRGVDLPATRRRQLARGELADLLVRERVIGWLAWRLREQEAGLDGGPEIVGERVDTVTRARRLVPRRFSVHRSVAVAASDAISPPPTALGSPGDLAG